MRPLRWVVVMLALWPWLAFGFSDPANLLDDFNRTSEGPPPSASWTSGLVATDPAGLVVASNTVLGKSATGGTGSAYWNQATYGPNVAVSLDGFDMAGGGAGQSIELWVRVPSVGNGYACRFYSDDSTIRLLRFASGSPTDLVSALTYDVVSGDRLGIEAVGNTIRCWLHEGTSWTMMLEATDSTYGSAGSVGARITSGLIFGDNFRAETLAASATLMGSRRRTW